MVDIDETNVYYDANAGNYVVFEENDDGTVDEVGAFTGATEYTFEREEFENAVDSGEFSRIAVDAVNDPAEFVLAFLKDSKYGSTQGYDEIDLTFAIEAVEIHTKNNLHFRS